jgi:hypothetical protein
MTERGAREVGRGKGKREEGKREMDSEGDITTYSARTPKVNATKRIDDICVYLTTGRGM